MEKEMTPELQKAFAALETRIRTILPDTYQDCYEEVQPVSMGSASLKYGPDGKVAWDQIWSTFCDLAMAGGPPHKGTLLSPASRAEIEAAPERYEEALAEICRGVGLVTRLVVDTASEAGWVRVTCLNNDMAAWLVRAIVMENVSARHDGRHLFLPAGPAYRVEKEIKNVVTSIAKTCHYWLEHTFPAQERAIGALFAEMEPQTPLIVPAGEAEAEAAATLAAGVEAAIHRLTGLPPASRRYLGWAGVACPDVQAAVWIMRALVASNVLARREETVLFVAVNPATDPAGERVVRCTEQIHGFAAARGVVSRSADAG
jgi:sirohydrochlorin cobaltochelatase